MQLYKAQYIYPVSSPPIANGIIAIDDERIAAVGPADEIAQQFPGASVTDLGAVMLLPKAVNAHTHLELTPLAELGKQYIADRSFVRWITELVKIWRTIPLEVQVEGARTGCRLLIESGTAVVADISNHHASLEPLLESGLYGVIYHEVLDPNPANAVPLLQKAQEQVRRWRSEYGEAHCPRSNFLLNCGRMPIEAYQEAGVLLALGTDSLSSSPSLSVWEEAASAMRVHRAAGVSLDPSDLLRICTLDGARALGFDDVLGSLEPGKLAKLAVGRINGDKQVANLTADEMLQLLWDGDVSVGLQ